MIDYYARIYFDWCAMHKQSLDIFFAVLAGWYLLPIIEKARKK